MHQQPDIYARLQDTALSDYFRNAGDKLVDESAVMSLAINSILQSEGHLNNKAIILWLIQALETTDDVVTADVIRKRWRLSLATPWTISNVVTLLARQDNAFSAEPVRSEQKNLAKARFFLYLMAVQWALTTTHIGPCPTA